jgi:hypothetical protein
MIVAVQVPDQFAKRFHLDEDVHSHQLLEAFVLQRSAEGDLTSGQVGEALGLSFHQTEQFLHDHNAPPHVTAEEQLEDLRNLEKILGR